MVGLERPTQESESDSWSVIVCAHVALLRTSLGSHFLFHVSRVAVSLFAHLYSSRSSLQSGSFSPFPLISMTNQKHGLFRIDSLGTITLTHLGDEGSGGEDMTWTGTCTKE